MALMKCPKCQNEIESTLESCPYCGYKEENNNSVNEIVTEVPVNTDSLSENMTSNISTNESVVSENQNNTEIQTVNVLPNNDLVQNNNVTENVVTNNPVLDTTMTNSQPNMNTNMYGQNQMNNNLNVSNQVNNNTTNDSFENLKKSPKQLTALIGAVCGTIFSFIFLIKMSLSSYALFFTIALAFAGLGLTLYIYNSANKKKNPTLLLGAIGLFLVAYLVRVIQIGLAQNIEYLIRYVLLFIGTALFFDDSFKGKNSKKTASVFLGIAAGDAIYNFFALNNVIITGYVWRLYLLAEVAFAVSMIAMEDNKIGDNELTDSTKKLAKKIPGATLMIVLVCIVAVATYFIGNSNISSSNNNLIDDSSNSGYIDEDDSYYEEEEEEEPKYETINLYKDKMSKVTGTYNGDPVEAEMTVKKIYTTDEVRPPAPQQYFYTYYPKKDNQKYLVVELLVKNTSGTDLNTDYVFSNFLGDNCDPKAVFDGKYEYTTFTAVALEKDSSNEYDFDKYYYIDPLESATMYLIYSGISNEIVKTSATIYGCFGENYLTFNS